MLSRNRKQMSAVKCEDLSNQDSENRVPGRPRHARIWAAGAVLAAVPLAASGQTPAGSQAVTPTPPPDACSGYSVCPIVDFQDVITSDADTRRVNAFITAKEAQTLQKILAGNYSADGAKSILGEVMIYDRNLSVNGLVACATCHTPQQAFTGGSSLLNQTTVAMVGAVGDRASGRKPMTYAYAPFAPVLSFRASTGDFVGGNFWDERATGFVTGNPAADQALGPPLNPVEMANPDAACVVYHLSQSQYRPLFEQVWGPQSFAITWPADTADQCAQPGGATTGPTSTVVDLSSSDRDQANTTFHEMGLSMASYEASPAVSPFSSKFDAVISGQGSFTTDEQRGYDLFTGQANCSQCHAVTGPKSMFTDFTAVNLGVPKNQEVPFYTENLPDSFGYTANPEGPTYQDTGLGAILPTLGNPDWTALAPKFLGTFQVATTRNVNKRPRASFVKGYMHNGYFKSLEQVVHFYNTRDVLPACPTNVSTEIGGAVGTECWPAPEVPTNVNHTQTGNLGLSTDDELSIVAFLRTLTDGFSP
jgi:cytochrome c peroxidase